jgi:hypothetical protein
MRFAALVAMTAALSLIAGCSKKKNLDDDVEIRRGDGTRDTTATTAAPAAASAAIVIPDVPLERSAVPKIPEWTAATEHGMQPPGCFWKVVREWLKLNCRADDPKAVTEISNLGVNGLDHFTWQTSGQVVDVIARLVRGRRGTARFELASQTLEVGYDWSDGKPAPEVIWHPIANTVAAKAEADECRNAPRTCPMDMFVQLATPQPSTPADYDYPLTQKMLLGRKEFSGTRVVEATRNGRRILGAIVKNRCYADRLVEIADDAMHTHPAAMCERIDVLRVIYTVP